MLGEEKHCRNNKRPKEKCHKLSEHLQKTFFFVQSLGNSNLVLQSQLKVAVAWKQKLHVKWEKVWDKASSFNPISLKTLMFTFRKK